MTFAREAWVFVLPIAALAVAAFFYQWPRTGVAIAALSILVLAFFRIPSRNSQEDEAHLLAPANGKITAIELVDEPLVGQERSIRITTFLSVFNIHVQRAPAAGRVIASRFTPGKKVAAFRSDAGEINQNHFVTLELPNGDVIGIKQIAGLVARRVVSYLEPEQQVERGELIGLIKFGSRVDLYLPESYEVLVSEGDTVTEGLTVMARIAHPPEAVSGAGSP